MTESTPLRLLVKKNNCVFTATLPFDSSLDDIMDAIKGILISIGYQNESYENWICEKAVEINDTHS